MIGTSNFFFQNYTNSNEQELLEDLIIESIGIYGSDCFYLPRTLTNYDALLGEDAQSSYTSSFMIALYLKNINGFAGDRNLMSKFAGLEIRDQVVFTMARRSFAQEIGVQTGFTRPREGDLLYFPMNRRIFQIRYVENFETMYQLGALQTYEITAELFEYSGEKLETGIADIDSLQTGYSLNTLDFAILDENNDWLVDEHGTILTTENFKTEYIDPMGDNDVLLNNVNQYDLFDWDENDPFSDGHGPRQEA